MADFDFGRVVGRTFAPLKNNPVTFFGLAFLLVGLPAALLGYFQQQATLDMLRQVEQAQTDDVVNSAALMGGFGRTMTWALGGGLISLITSALLQGSLVHAAVADFRGGKASMGASLSTGLKHLLPLIVISILFAIGVGFGFLFFIIPGLFLLVKWIVAIPSEVAESTGIGGAFSRSWALTKGHWWVIFGLLVLYAVVSVIVQTVVSLPFSGLGALSAGDDPFAVVEAASSPLALFVAALIATVQGAIAAAGVAALYYELRHAGDGVGAEDLADVFA